MRIRWPLSFWTGAKRFESTVLQEIPMKFARWVFRIAGIYGLIVLAPQYFIEEKFGLENPPPITHPEFFYGFIGVGLAWQIAFLIIAQDPAKYRAMMLPGVFEKFSFAAAVSVLFVRNRLPTMLFAAGMIDLLLGVLFIVSWRKVAAESKRPA